MKTMICSMLLLSSCAYQPVFQIGDCVILRSIGPHYENYINRVVGLRPDAYVTELYTDSGNWYTSGNDLDLIPFGDETIYRKVECPGKDIDND